ncbi:MAG: TonB-dependent receptor [Gemmatimonadetes bacterium RIFCSPLOWO2_12_FULL_68_9]|nr:MAG: TonB-dependent receptor [Gemmatimonadetes bacterium RIFCSPLOWO2_12_FULL_68_9]
MRTLRLLPLALALFGSQASAQALRLTGRVTDPDGKPIAAVRVEERGTLNRALTRSDGTYELRVSSPDAIIVFSAVGYRRQDVSPAGSATLDVRMELPAFALEGIEVVGTRRANRSIVETPVAIDVIDIAEATRTTGQLDVNQLLHYAAPSFNANRQSGADGADHVDPASIRGLGPDQTLVLINGKRRHQSSLINIFGSRGRGNTGTDLNAIPLAAIERIEILRDGASAQYGSDAIAGVMNVVLKETVNEFSGSIATGFFNASPPSNLGVLRPEKMDGENVQISANYGIPVGQGGFVNLTGEYLTKQRTNRPADPAEFSIYRRQFGDAALDNFGTFVNSRVPINPNVAFYAFGGYNFRHTDAYAWSRDAASERNVPAIYPQGFDPRILSDITDQSLAAGLRAKVGNWDVDIGNAWGANRFHYFVDGTLNASLLEKSPTRFDAGGFAFGQNTTGVTFSRFFPQALAGVNLAVGAERRMDHYTIFAGEEGSYRNYGIVDSVISGRVVQVDVLGRPGGSQGFPGFQPADEVDETRTNLAGFVDLELDLTPRVTLGGAARFEDYSDFGTTLNGKLAARVEATEGLAFRGSVSTGFRGPSLAQIYFNSTFTDFVAGVPVDKLIARNQSPITRTLGIPSLTEETATNASVGFTARFGDFTATVDGYFVDVNDRIVLTGAFEDTDPDIGADLQQLGVGAAQFFTNAISTETRGVDVILTYQRASAWQRWGASLAANVNHMELGTINTSPKLRGKEDTYYGPREQFFLLASAPDSKISFQANYGVGSLDALARFTRFGEVTLIDWLDTEDVYAARITTDASASYRLSNNLSFTIGGDNLFNRYPSQQDTETETGGLWDAVQMGFSGAFYYARLSFKI